MYGFCKVIENLIYLKLLGFCWFSLCCLPLKKNWIPVNDIDACCLLSLVIHLPSFAACTAAFFIPPICWDLHTIWVPLGCVVYWVIWLLIMYYFIHLLHFWAHSNCFSQFKLDWFFFFFKIVIIIIKTISTLHTNIIVCDFIIRFHLLTKFAIIISCFFHPLFQATNFPP